PMPTFMTGRMGTSLAGEESRLRSGVTHRRNVLQGVEATQRTAAHFARERNDARPEAVQHALHISVRDAGETHRGLQQRGRGGEHQGAKDLARPDADGGGNGAEDGSIIPQACVRRNGIPVAGQERAFDVRGDLLQHSPAGLQRGVAELLCCFYGEQAPVHFQHACQIPVRRALCGFERSRGLQLRDRLREDGAYEALHVSRALHKALPDELLQSVGVRKGSGGEAAVRQLQERKQRWQVRAHTRKYFWARGKRSAGGQVARSPSMRTSYVSGSTSMR